jgi:antibiotic biosynthesis monooxygenase (ABM) superfamily enzyme
MTDLPPDPWTAQPGSPTGPEPEPEAAPSPPDPSAPILRLRGPRASTVIVQHWPAVKADTFMAWQREVAALAGAYPGYQATEVYPPTGDGDEWVIIVHFDDEALLQAWLDAPERSAWLAKLPAEALGFRQQTMPTGFGSWVAGQTADGTRVSHWKSFLLVLVGLYPVVMLLTLIVSPRISGLGMAFAMLVGNILSVAILEWAVMPLLNRFLAPWLQAHGRDGRLVSVVGAALIVASVLAMALVFRVVNG